MHRKKGQFFIISAVIIILALFTLNSNLNTDWKGDVADSQLSDASAILSNIQDGINATVAASGSNNLAENLDRFALAEKNSMKGGFDVNIIYSISVSSVAANITLKSNSIYVEKKLW